jgi:hypothetical protein
MPVFQEYPKTVYFPDGRVYSVANLTEETTYLAAGWTLAAPNLAHGVQRIPASTVTGSAAAIILPPNEKRLTVKFVNDSPAQAIFVYGAAASSVNFTWVLDPGERWEMPIVLRAGTSFPEWDGLITGYWASAVGAMQVTETEFP